MQLFLCTLLLTWYISSYVSLRIQSSKPTRFSTAINLWGQPGLQTSPLRDWINLPGARVLLPNPASFNTPKSIIHFTGGFLVGAAPVLAYNDLLESLASKGHIIIATPIPLISLNHQATATSCLNSFESALKSIESSSHSVKASIASVPIIGLSHSLGGKLTALMSLSSTKSSRCTRLGNVFMSFNNFGYQQSSSTAPIGVKKQEFTPSPKQTWERITDTYIVPRTLILKFTDDKLDQSVELADAIGSSESDQRSSIVQTQLLLLQGTHLTPCPIVTRDNNFLSEVASKIEEVLEGSFWGADGLIEARREKVRLAAAAAWRDKIEVGSDAMEDVGKRVEPPASTTTTTIATTIPDRSWEARYYSDITGFGADYITTISAKTGRKMLASMGKEETYGEITVSGWGGVLCRIKDKVGPSDVFFDLGSGVGKVVAQIAIETDCGSCFGIELGERRHKNALQAKNSMAHSSETDDFPTATSSSIGLKSIQSASRRMHFLNLNMLSEEAVLQWTNSTILFINAVCYPPELWLEIERLMVLKCTKLKFIILGGQVIGSRPDGATSGPEVQQFLSKFTKVEVPASASWQDDFSMLLYTAKNNATD